MWYTNIIGTYLYRYYKIDDAYSVYTIIKTIFFPYRRYTCDDRSGNRLNNICKRPLFNNIINKCAEMPTTHRYTGMSIIIYTRVYS